MQIKKLFATVFTAVLMMVTYGEAFAHGERNQEPFLRMRTLQWYDVTFSIKDDATIKVNDTVTMTGKVRFFSNWPLQVPKPDAVFLGNATPGPTMTRVETRLNGKIAIQSAPVVIGRDYEFKVVLRARIPGRHHIHPMFNVQNAGGLVGPGIWVNIEGEYADFVQPLDTLTDVKIENLENYGVRNVVMWHSFWFIVALIWIIWWIRRPMILPRYLLTKHGKKEGELITKADVIFSAGMLVFVIAVLLISTEMTGNKYPRTVPLQGGRLIVDPLPLPDKQVKVEMTNSEYYLPGRTVKTDLVITNHTESPVQLGEMTTANVRFINKAVSHAVQSISPDYPADLVADNGLILSDLSPILPGETRTIHLEATDSVWEIERLSSLMNNPESAIGALLMFYDNEGNRFLADMYGQIIPTFK